MVMKINKFNESAETDEIKIEIKELFSSIWKDKLNLDTVSVQVSYPSANAMYHILTSPKNNINNNTYEDFYELFNLLKKANAIFEISNYSKQITITISDVEKFLICLREKNDIKPPNL